MAGNYNELVSVIVTDMDIATPTIKVGWQKTRGVRVDFAIRIGSTEIINFENITESGRQTILKLTSEQRSTILSAMSTVQEQEVTFALKTYLTSTTTTLAGTSTQDGTLRTTEANSAPVFTRFTCTDYSGSNIQILDDATKYIQNKSTIRFICSTATARSESTIVSYTATIGTKSMTRSTTTINFGMTDMAGECEASVTVTDSRGYQTTVTLTLDIVAYSPISINTYRFRRINYVEADTVLEFTGYYSLLEVGGVDKNAFDSATYTYRELPSGAWSDDVTITGITANNGTISFSANPWLTLDNTKSYEFEFTFMDTVGTSTFLYLTLSKATALMSMRETGVGIRTSDPQRALDVNGDIGMNGYNVLGIVREINDDESLNSIKGQGIYTRTESIGELTDSYPVESKGILEVIGNTDNLIQRFTDIVNNNVYCRTYYLVSGTSHAWTQWKQL